MKAEEVFVKGETVFLKKGVFGYRVVHPIMNDDDKIIWINLLVGGWGNFWILMFILLVVSCFLYGFKEITASCNDMTENPCDYTNLDCSTNFNYQGDFRIGGDTYEEKGT